MVHLALLLALLRRAAPTGPADRREAAPRDAPPGRGRSVFPKHINDIARRLGHARIPGVARDLRDRARSLGLSRRELDRRRDAGQIDADAFAEEEAKLQRALASLQQDPVAHKVPLPQMGAEGTRDPGKQTRAVRSLLLLAVVTLVIGAAISILYPRFGKRYRRKRSDRLPAAFDGFVNNTSV
jgi:hypothetical protein